MNRLGRLASLVAIIFLAGQQAATAGGPVDVTIADNSFTPANVPVAAIGNAQPIRWTNEGDLLHTSTSDGFDGTNGPKLWQSGDIAYLDSFQYVPRTAGTFKYHCTNHPEMKAKFTVSVILTEESVATGEPFDIIWAEVAIPDGYNVDVQIKKPGKTEFKDFDLDNTGVDLGVSYTPLKVGTYEFRARTQKGGRDDRASKYSPPSDIAVVAPV